MSKDSVVIEDSRRWQKILSEHKELKKLMLKVGLFGEGTPDVNYAARGAVLHEGSTKMNIPSRPFMKEAHEKNIQTIDSLIDDLYLLFLQDKIKAKQFYLRLGLAHKKHIQESIKNNPWQAVSEKTQAKKGYNKTKPLIDKGILINQIRVQVSETDYE